MMNKKICLTILAVGLLCSCGCHRPRVKHDHRTKVMHVRVAEDSLQKDDIEGMDESWKDEELIAIPDAPADAKAEAHPEVDKEIENILMGKE